jgi:S-formylglutathione hydrolase FrmB
VRRGLAAAFVLALLAVAAIVAVKLTGAEPSSDQVTTEKFTLHSTLLDRDLQEILLVPHAGPKTRRNLLVLLHGRTGDLDGPKSMLSDELFRALEKLGPAAPAVLLVNGGKSSYFHDRADGPWGRYVMTEAIPAGIRRAHARRDRVAIGGISMGGFGALDLAAAAPGRFCAVGGHSPAIFVSGALSAPGAFDDGEDFARHDVLARSVKSDPYAGTPVWLDAGDQDPFREAVAQLGVQIHRTVHIWPGKHEGAYWHKHMAAYLRFYAGALKVCR